MTKAYLHGRTESIRTVQPESFHFVKVGLLCIDATDERHSAQIAPHPSKRSLPFGKLASVMDN